MTTVFFGYYTPENYKLLLKLADDRKNLDDKWEDWLIKFIKLKTSLSRDFTVEEVHLDVKKMDEYFKLNKIKNKSKNRSQYIQEQGMIDANKRMNN